MLPTRALRARAHEANCAWVKLSPNIDVRLFRMREERFATSPAALQQVQSFAHSPSTDGATSHFLLFTL